MLLLLLLLSWCWRFHVFTKSTLNSNCAGASRLANSPVRSTVRREGAPNLERVVIGREERKKTILKFRGQFDKTLRCAELPLIHQLTDPLPLYSWYHREPATAVAAGSKQNRDDLSGSAQQTTNADIETLAFAGVTRLMISCSSCKYITDVKSIKKRFKLNSEVFPACKFI